MCGMNYELQNAFKCEQINCKWTTHLTSEQYRESSISFHKKADDNEQCDHSSILRLTCSIDHKRNENVNSYARKNVINMPRLYWRIY